MSAIDNRVVRMEFQNSQFESGIKTSVKSLENLKNSLNLSGATKGLDELGASVKHFSLDSIGESVDQISQKFTALGIAGITALQNITNKAVDAGLQMAKALTVDQVTSGFSKYEQKTASVQTLMNSTGKSIEEINGYLDKLMWFSDETSYGFTDMTSALAQMTITGGKIEKLVPMLMGVANATAFAGKGANEFSHIIYNLAQSYATGSLKLIDWKSVELMGGASIQLKQALIDAGEALGTIEKGQVTISNFTEDLTEGAWATQEVMEMAFGSFAEMTEKAYEMVQSGEVDTASEAYEILAQTYDNVAMKAARSAQEAKTFGEAIDATKDAVSSGWMATFDIIFGNYEEAKVLWTDLANGLWDLFAAGANDRNEMLQTWKDLGGRDSLIASATNIIKAFGAVLGPIRDAFQAIFPPMTAERLLELTKGFEEFTSKLILSEDASHGIQKVFEGIFTVVKLLLSPLKLVVAAIGILPDFIGPLVNGFLQLVGALGDASSAFLTFENLAQVGKDLFDYLCVSYYEGGMGLAGIIEVIFDSINDILTFGLRSIANIIGIDAEDAIESMRTSIQKVRNVVNDFVFDLQNAIVTGDWSKFQNVFDFIQDRYVKGGEGLAGVLEVMFDSIILAVDKGLNKLSSVTGLDLSKIKMTMLNVIRRLRKLVTDFVLDFQTAFQSGNWQKMQDLIDYITVSYIEGGEGLAGILEVMFDLATAALSKGLRSLAYVFGIDAGGFVESISKLIQIIRNAVVGFVRGIQEAFTLGDFTTLETVFAVPLSILDKLKDFGNKVIDALNPLNILKDVMQTIADGLFYVIDGFSSRFSKLLDSISYDKIYKTFNVAFFGLFATGILKVGSAIKDFSKEVKAAKIGEIVNQIGDSFSKAIDELGATLRTFQMGIKADILKKIAVSVGILAAALLALSHTEPEKLNQGIKGLTAIMIELSGAILAFGLAAKKLKIKQIYVVGMAFVELSAAVLILSFSIQKLGSMDLENLKVGLVSVGIALLELVGSMIFLSRFGGKIEKSGLSMVALSLAIKKIAEAVELMGKLSWEEMTRGLRALFAVLVDIVGFVFLLPELGPKTATGLIGVSVAITILARAVESFGKLDWNSVAKGLVSVTVLLGALSGAAILVYKNLSRVTGSSGLPKYIQNLRQLSGKGTNSFPETAKGLKDIGIAFIEMAAAIAILSISVSKLSALSPEQLLYSLGAVIASLIGMSLALKMLPNDSEKSAMAAVVLSGAMYVLGSAIEKFCKIVEQYGYETFGNAILYLAMSLVGVMAVLNYTKSDGVIKIAAAFMLIVNSLIPLVAAIWLLGKIPSEQASAGLMLIAGSLIVFGAISAFLVPLADGLIKVSLAFAIFGAGTFAVGAGVAILAAGLIALGGAIMSLSAIAGQLTTAISAAMEGIFIGISNGLMTFIQILDANAPIIWEAFKNLFLSGLNTMAEVVPEIVKTFNNVLKVLTPEVINSGFELLISFLTGMSSNIYQVTNIVIQIILGFLTALSENLSTIIEAGFILIISFFNGLADGIEQHLPELLESMWRVGGAIVEGLISGIGNLLPQAVEAIKNLGKSILNGIKDFLGIHSPSTEFMNIGEFSIEGLINGFNNKEGDATNALGDLAGQLLGQLDISDDAEATGADSFSALFSGFTNGQSSLLGATDDMQQSVLSLISNEDSNYQQAGQGNMESYKDGILDKKTEIVNAITTILNEVISKLKTYDTQFKEQGRKLVQAIIDGIKEKQDDFKKVGENLVDGFIEGIRSKIQAAAAAAAEMAKSALDAAMDELDERSPSKEFFRIGEYVPLGFAEGIRSAIPTSNAESRNMADEAMDTLKNSLSRISDYLSEDLDAAPTIRPVLDLSDVRKGSMLINDMLQTNRVLDISGIDANVKAIQANVASVKSAQTSEPATDAQAGDTYTFNQYNTSPKALSRTEIYRQSKNLFSQFRGRVDKI